MMKEQCLLPCACAYRNMNVIIPPHPTPPSGSYLACGGKQNQSLVAVRTFQNLTAASDWFLLPQVIEILLPQVIVFYCRKWRLSPWKSWQDVCHDMTWQLSKEAAFTTVNMFFLIHMLFNVFWSDWSKMRCTQVELACSISFESGANSAWVSEYYKIDIDEYDLDIL